MDDNLKVEKVKVTFTSLESGNSAFDAIFFIEQQFQWLALSKSERLRVLEYLRQESESMFEM